MFLRDEYFLLRPNILYLDYNKEHRMKTKEIIFIVNESLDGGYEAKAVGYPIFTEAENEESIKKNITEAVRCHFDESELPSLINIRFQREEVISL